MSDQQQRTERATPRKREKAREKGQVFRSREVAGAITFMAGVAGFAVFGGAIKQSLSESMKFFFAASATADMSVVELASEAVRRVSFAGMPLMALAVVSSVVGNCAQSLPLITFEPFKPDPKRLFSFSKLAKPFSLSGAADSIRGVLGLSALAVVGWTVLAPEIPNLQSLASLSTNELSAWMGGLMLRLLVRSSLVFGLIAVVDYVLKYRQYENKMKMTKQEVKEEQKQIEGDPQVKAKIRRLRRAVAQQRMMAAVPTATVVITNPTHVAVALSYDSETSPAPRVIAKGKGELAQRIREVARKNNVAVHEDPPLARALYPTDVGGVIPAELYKAVAEILAHLVRVTGVRL